MGVTAPSFSNVIGAAAPLRTMKGALKGLDPGGGFYWAGPAQATPV